MRKNFFITATDTGAGKTFVGASIASLLRGKGIKVGVMKPVETGCGKKNGRLLPKDALKLKKAAGSDEALSLINPYRFSPPLAPSIAGSMAGIRIDLKKIKKSFEVISEKNDVTIVEGIGGLLTPLTEDATVLDLILLISIPVLIVAPSKLGCINSTLLTYRYARESGVKVQGVILNHPTDLKDESSEFNSSELKRLKIPLKAELPFFKEGESDSGLKKIIEPMLFKPRHGLLCS